jgi:foldase protein PrsA
VKGLKRYAGVATAVAVTAMSASACNTSPGAAALVGDDRISVSHLQQEVDDALANPQAQQQLGADRIGFVRTELARLITNHIVVAAAAAHGIRITQADIDTQLAEFSQQAGGTAQLLQQAEQSGIPRAELSSFTRYYVLQQKLGDELVASVPVSQAELEAAYQQNIDSYDQVHSAHILVKTKALADNILAQVKADPSKFAPLASRYSIDTSNKDSGGDLGFAGQGQFVPSFSHAIFAAKPGTFIEVHSKFGWHVVHVIAHKHVTLAQATPELKTTILKDTRDKLLSQALSEEGKKLGVHVNPRYGVWDFARGSVVAPPAKDALTSPTPSPAAAGLTTPAG